MEELVAVGVIFNARGHPSIRASHRATLEITVDDYLTPRGDCIVGISAEFSPQTLPDKLKDVISKDDSIVVLILCSEGICDSIVGRGSSKMSLTDSRRMVFRRSNYVGPETVMVGASKAAAGLRRDLVEILARGGELTVALLAFKAETLISKPSEYL